MITFFEYSDSAVESGLATGKLCVATFPKQFKIMTIAERVYSIEGNTLTEIKNRNGAPGTMHISDEDKVVLMLKAVPI